MIGLQLLKRDISFKRPPELLVRMSQISSVASWHLPFSALMKHTMSQKKYEGIFKTLI